MRKKSRKEKEGEIGKTTEYKIPRESLMRIMFPIESI